MDSFCAPAKDCTIAHFQRPLTRTLGRGARACSRASLLQGKPAPGQACSGASLLRGKPAGSTCSPVCSGNLHYLSHLRCCCGKGSGSPNFPRTSSVDVGMPTPRLFQGYGYQVTCSQSPCGLAYSAGKTLYDSPPLLPASWAQLCGGWVGWGRLLGTGLGGFLPYSEEVEAQRGLAAYT